MQKFIVLVCLNALFISTVFAHGNNSHYPQTQDVTIKISKIVGNLYLLQGRGGNIAASVGGDGILIVDDDYKQVSEKLSAALKDLGSAMPKYILNTHWHGDHTEGNLFFGGESIIIAHANVRKRLSQDNTLFGQVTKAYPKEAWPVITYQKEMSIYFNGDEVRAVYYPNGHTDGDTVVFFTNMRTVHLGDDFFVGRFPFVDLENGGSVQGLISNIGQLINDIPADAKIIPGHGPISTITDLKNYHAALIESSKIVEDAMKQKKTLEEIKSAGLPEKFKEWGSGFIKTDAWIETVYKSASKK